MVTPSFPTFLSIFIGVMVWVITENSSNAVVATIVAAIVTVAFNVAFIWIGQRLPWGDDDRDE